MRTVKALLARQLVDGSGSKSAIEVAVKLRLWPSLVGESVAYVKE